MESFDLDKLNEHFTYIACQHTDKTDSLGTSVCNFRDSANFQISNITLSDVFLAWKLTKHTKKRSPDPSGIAKYMLDLILPIPNFFEAITYWANLCFQNGYIPSYLKTIKVVPIPKVSNPKSLNDFRPISISCNLLLLLEKIYLTKITSYLQTNAILSPCQFGFRPQLSTEHAMITVTDFIKKCIDKGESCILVSVDLKKAFDSVPRENLLLKIRNNYSISDVWLRSFLADRYQFISLHNSDSHLLKTVRGVPQGSILGPILFSLYINDMPDHIKHGMTELFADDSNFCFAVSKTNIDTIETMINEDMTHIARWSQMNEMPLNETKCKFIVFPSKSKIFRDLEFTVAINGVLLERVKTLKCLGLILDEKLTWKPHIDKLAQHCYARIRGLYCIKPFFDQNHLQILSLSMVYSLLNYMIVIWGTANNSCIKVVEKVVRSLARLVLGVKKFEPIAHDICSRLGWLLPKYLYTYFLLINVYKVVKGQLTCFPSYFLPNFALDNYRFRSPNALCRNFFPNTSLGANTFHYEGIKQWNELPFSIKNSISLAAFKSSLKEFLLEKQTSLV